MSRRRPYVSLADAKHAHSIRLVRSAHAVSSKRVIYIDIAVLFAYAERKEGDRHVGDCLLFNFALLVGGLLY